MKNIKIVNDWIDVNDYIESFNINDTVNKGLKKTHNQVSSGLTLGYRPIYQQ